MDPSNPELVARIRGQTRDLPIRLSYVRAQLGPSPAPEALQALAAREGAQLVVQVSPLPSGAHAVLIYDAERRSLRRREAPRPARRDRFARSAAAETIALIVRGELTDALHAREQERPDAGASAPEVGAAPPPSAAAGASADAQSGTPPKAAGGPRAADSARDQPATVAASPALGRPREGAQSVEVPEPQAATHPGGWLSFALGAGLRLTYAGPERLFAAAQLRLALRSPYVTLAVSGSTSLRDEAHVQTLVLGLREHTAAAELSARIPLARTLELSLGPAAGVALHQRDVQGAASDWVLRADRTYVSATIGARAELALRLARHLAVCVQVGVDAMLRPLRFEVAPDGEISRLNTLLPWASLHFQAEL